jgi:hypothetical protein
MKTLHGVGRRAARSARLAFAAGFVLLATACGGGIEGRAVPAEVEPPTARESATQSVLDFGEAAVLRYQGTLLSAPGQRITFDVNAALTGEIVGTITLEGHPATLLVVDGMTYVKAASVFWEALSGIAGSDGKGAAIADRWVKVPAPLLGVEFRDVFAPDILGEALREDIERAGDEPLAEGERTTSNGVPVIRVGSGSGTLYVAEKEPHGLVRIEVNRIGRSDTTSAGQVVADVTDLSADAAKFYRDTSAQATGLDTAVDLMSGIEEGPHRFDACGAASCAIVVEFTNTSKVAVRVSVRATWTGDNAPLGVCDAQTGPVPPGQSGSATCTISSREWVDFYRRANSVPGDHPYSAEWSTLVLADAPDLTRLTANAAAAPADAGTARTEGSHYVYVINRVGENRKPAVWKYGVVPGDYWKDQAAGQLDTCTATTGGLCTARLVTAADSAAAAHGLLTELVTAYRQTAGGCPSAQWVSCRP